MRYTGQQLAQMAGMTRQTFMKHVSYLTDEGKFTKMMPGSKGFSERDAEHLVAIMGFTLKAIEDGTKRIRTRPDRKSISKRQKNTSKRNRTNDSRRKKSARKLRRSR